MVTKIAQRSWAEKNVGFELKSALLLCHFNQEWKVSKNCSKTLKHLTGLITKILSAVFKLLHANRQKHTAKLCFSWECTYKLDIIIYPFPERNSNPKSKCATEAESKTVHRCITHNCCIDPGLLHTTLKAGHGYVSTPDDETSVDVLKLQRTDLRAADTKWGHGKLKTEQRIIIQFY
jgi:hypothetical protein